MTYIKRIVLNDNNGDDATTYEVGKDKFFWGEKETVKSINLSIGDFDMNGYVVKFESGLRIEIPYHSVLLTVEVPEEK